MAEVATGNKKKRNLVIICICIAILIIGVVIGALLWPADKAKVAEKENVYPESDKMLEGLHTFPEIEFEDSLYYQKVLVSYDDDSPRDIYYYEKDEQGQPTDKKVHETHLYPDHKKYIDGNVADDGRDGLWYAYHKNGNVQTMAHYRDGKEDGKYAVYHENGKVFYAGMYDKGVRVGKWFFYDDNEQLVKIVDYDVTPNKITDIQNNNINQ